MSGVTLFLIFGSVIPNEVSFTVLHIKVYVIQGLKTRKPNFLFKEKN